jgi:CubicO group peptidase (beta-lactamase class C family)
MMYPSSSKLIAPVLLSLSLVLPSCKVGRFFIYNFADITDHKKFHSRELEASGQPFNFIKTEDGKAPKSITVKGQETTFGDYLEDRKTVAFLIIRNDTIHYEQYFNKYGDSSIVASFSMAKSVTSMLIGCAIRDGLIGSVDDPVTKYIPELKENGFEEVKIGHLLQMTSGLDFNESYTNPFGGAATIYYGRRLYKVMSKMKLGLKPGEKFSYSSGTTQLLGWVLERALKDKKVTDYLQEQIWTPLGMEYSASWSIDRKKDGIEKTYCCLNARARDFAKLGRLYLHDGNWNGQQVVPADWVKASTTADGSYGGADYYQYQWWIHDHGFSAIGILGQHVYVQPDKNLIIVRLGKSTAKTDWSNFSEQVAKLY